MRRIRIAATVAVLASGAAAQTCIPEFAVHDLLQGFPFAFSINGGDMDGDGDVDILIPAFDLDPTLMLNDGSDDPQFDGLRLSGRSGDYVASVADIDGDGDADILSSSWGFFIWYENLGGDPVEFYIRDVTDLDDTTGCGGADFLAFLNTWNAGEEGADINGDASIDTLDVLAYLNLWVEGCG